MNKKLIASLVGLAFTSPFLQQTAFAAEQVNLDEVVVTASRVPQPKESVIADVTVIDREEIERAGQSTLSELLSTQSGIEIESNGGMGATSNIHIRGNNSQSVVVLIDGMRVASATLGTTSFSQILPEQIDHIEIVRGPASSLYGSDAVGGVIQIFTKQGQHGSPFVASAGIGSHNTQQTSVMFNGANESTRFSVGVASLTTDGISSLRTNTGLDADKDAFRNLSFNGNIYHTFAEGQEIGAQLFTTNGHYNFDGDNFPAYQDLRQEIFAITSNNKVLDAWASHFKIGKSLDTQSSVGSFGDSYLRTTQQQFSWQNDLKLPLGNLVLAYDRLEDKVSGNIDFSQKKRLNNGYLASYLLNYDAHAFKLGLRRDNNSQFGGHTTGNIGYGYQFSNAWRASASYGTAFRAPTFNDLYWPFQDFGAYGTYKGNSALKPETSSNTEATVSYNIGQHKVSATIFHNNVDNLLICCQGLFNDSPANVGTATIKGLSLSYEGQLSNYQIRANADIQDPRNDDTNKILARRSKQHGAIWLGQQWGDWELGGELLASGKRYNDSDNAIKLAGYALLNFTAKYAINQDWSINVRANNVLDKQYALATTRATFNLTGPDYNTPGSNLFVSVRYSPSK